MPVLHRHLASFSFAGSEALGAIPISSDRTRVVFRSGIDVGALAARLGSDVPLRQVGRNIIADCTGPVDGAEAAETEIFDGRNVLFAIRRSERAEDAVDWLQANKQRAGVDAALILMMSEPEESDRFARNLTTLLGEDDCPILVVTTDCPLCLPDAPDLRDPANGTHGDGEGARGGWSGPLHEIAIFELLRQRFLSNARAVAALDIADLLLSPLEASPFDAAAAVPGKAIPLLGVEAYPWRLRKGAPAPHSDHAAVRVNERRWLASWCVSPGGLPPEVVFQPGVLVGVEKVEQPIGRFSRAMGVIYPGVPVNKLVRRGDLVDDPERRMFLVETFGKEPLSSGRSRSAPKRPESDSVTVVTAMKDEGPFIVDWLAHMRVIGADQILVFTNDCSDGTDSILDALAPAGVIRRDNPYRQTGSVPQHAAFRAAAHEAVVKDAGWLLTLDVDEFPVIRTGEGRLTDLFAATERADLISLPWRLFGNADEVAFADEPVWARFRRAAPEYAPRPLQAWGFKTIYRNSGLFRRLGVHRPRGLDLSDAVGLRWADGSGRPLPPRTWQHGWRMTAETWGYDLVQLNHYAVRSAESFLVKRARGRVNHVDRDQGAAYWFRMNHNQEEDRRIDRYTDAVRTEKKALLALPQVAELHEAAVAWHRQRIAALKRAPDFASLYRLITSDRMQRLSRLTTRFGMQVFLEGPHVVPDEVAARDPAEDFFFTVDAARASGTGAVERRSSG